MGINFHLLACRTAVDIVFDEDSHSGPPVVSSDKFERLELSGVSGGK
jgi:hypothetical protein